MKIGFTTGCFDGMHEGHKYFISRAFDECDLLIIGLNTDKSVRFLKGAGRPFRSFESRARMLAEYIGDEGVGSIVPYSDEHRWNLIDAFEPDMVLAGWDQVPQGTHHSIPYRSIPIVRIGRGPDVSTSMQAEWKGQNDAA